MKKNILTVVLCLASVALGFVLNSYWHYSDELLKTDEAFAEDHENSEFSLANFRAMQYSKNDLDIKIYQAVLRHYLDSQQELESFPVEIVARRYKRLVEDSVMRHEVVGGESDDAIHGKQHSLSVLTDAKAFIAKNPELFEQ